MIGKVIIGKSFRGCLAYCLGDKALKQGAQTPYKNRADVLYYHRCFGDTKELAEQFKDVRQLNLKVSKPVLHITLSFAPGEKVEKENLLAMVKACAGAMGFDKNQYIAISHADTVHQHLHIVANRIGFDGRTVSDSNSYKKIADYCRKTEQAHGLKQVLSPRNFLPKEQQNLPRIDSRKETLKTAIKNSLAEAKSYAGFEEKIKALGYRVEKGRGIAFIDNKGVKIKGSNVGFSLQTIEKRLAPLSAIRSRVIKVNLVPEPIGSLQKERPLLLIKNIDKAASQVLDPILRAEENSAAIPAELLKRKRKNVHIIYNP